MIAIKHRFSAEILCEFDVETVKRAAEKGKADLDGANLDGANLRGADLDRANLYGANLKRADLRGADLGGANLDEANLRGANLGGANLRGADLRGADLRGADLRGADLEGEKITKSPLSINGLHYRCLISDSYMRLGCKRFTHKEWSEFNDDRIRGMDSGALAFWKQWKAPLLAMCATHSSSKVGS